MNQGHDLKKQILKIWKNNKAKQKVLKILKKFGSANVNVQEKFLKNHKGWLINSIQVRC